MSAPQGMACTRCGGDADDLDTAGLKNSVILDLCRNWLCKRCLDDEDNQREYEDRCKHKEGLPHE